MEQKDNVLYETLEKIIFNESHLTLLKEGIHQVSIGKLSAKILKEQIFESQVNMFKEILAFFPFYAEHFNNNIELDNFINKEDSSEELKMKNKLIEEIGTRVKRIYEKLKGANKLK